MTKMGGILPLLTLLPLLFSGLTAAGGVTGAAAGIADSVHKKQADRELERHHRALEGSGLYLGRQTTGGCCPRCKGSGLYLGKKN